MSKNKQDFNPKYTLAKYLVVSLAFFTGTLFLHKFALGYYSVATGSIICVFMILMIAPLFAQSFISWALVLLVAIVPPWLGVIEAIIYLKKTPDEFIEKYIKNRKYFL